MGRHRRQASRQWWRPWRRVPAPGKVFVDEAELIDLLQRRVRALELEQETAALRAQGDVLRREAAARQLLDGLMGGGEYVRDSAVVSQLLAALPAGPDGALHEAALRAWARDRLPWCPVAALTSREGGR